MSVSHRRVREVISNIRTLVKSTNITNLGLMKASISFQVDDLERSVDRSHKKELTALKNNRSIPTGTRSCSSNVDHASILKLNFLDDPIISALARLGWSSHTSPTTAEVVWSNPGWPGSRLTTGGGWSLVCGTLPQLLKHWKYFNLAGIGSDYDELAILLTIAGPSEADWLHRKRAWLWGYESR